MIIAKPRYEYDLRLLTAVTAGTPVFVDSITKYANGWRRSTRMQGGYWMGSFTITNASKSLADTWFYEYLGFHLEEHSAGIKTWEGMVYEISHDADAARLDITVCGYVHAANWRFLTANAGSAGSASTWINTVITTDLTEFHAVGRIQTNSLSVSRVKVDDMRVWDEIARIAGLGDASYNPWRAYVDNDRKIYYEQMPQDPQYYLKSGVVRRRSLDSMYNSVGAGYTTTAGVPATVAAVTVPVSTARFGTRQEQLYLDTATAAQAGAYVNTYLRLSGWPFGRAIGTRGAAHLYTSAGGAVEVNPWTVKPCVVRDMSAPARRQSDTSGWQTRFYLADERDFFIDEVEVSAEQGMTLKTQYYDDGDAMQSQLDYYNSGDYVGFPPPDIGGVKP